MVCAGGGGERRTVEDQEKHHEGPQVQELAPALAGIRLQYSHSGHCVLGNVCSQQSHRLAQLEHSPA